ncbi:MAG: hypothetical protein M1826_003615 [Phylliscum demangeonii]|nr:MAG: hypothetical protein M1826_003615 [Phylliscum demangeonii]
MGSGKDGRRRRSSSLIYVEPAESIEQLSDQAALPNLNADWVNAKGAWTIHIVLIISLKILYDILPGVSSQMSWTLTNISYMFGSYIMFHYVRGIPFDFNAGAYDNLNMWEQIDHGDQYTPAKKFLLSVPIVLFLLSTHYTHYDLTYFVVNFLATLAVVIPKLPFSHRMRISLFSGNNQALSLLTHLLTPLGPLDASLPSIVYIPPPDHLSLLITLIVHPALTGGHISSERSQASNAAWRYLSSANQLLGPIKANFAAAFAFNLSTRDRRGGQDRRKADQSERQAEEHAPHLINSSIAHEGSLWACAEDFWHVVGWAFNSSTTYPKRWSRWKLCLQLMLDILDDDWAAHVEIFEQEPRDRSHDSAETALTNALITKFLSDSSRGMGGQRRVMRAVFADGSLKSQREFREIFRDETRAWKNAEDGRKRKRDAKVNIDEDVFGDYFDPDDQEAGTLNELALATRSIRKSAALATVDDDGGHPSPETAPAEVFSVILRQRLFSLLCEVSAMQPGRLQTSESLFDAYLDFVRPMPVPAFALFFSPITSAPHMTLLTRSRLTQFVLRAFISTSAPLPPSQQPLPPQAPAAADGTRLSWNILHKCYLRFAACTTSVHDNAKVSLLVEELTKLWYANRRDGRDDLTTEALMTLEDAIEEGVTARHSKIVSRHHAKATKADAAAPAPARKSKAKAKVAEEEEDAETVAQDWLAGSLKTVVADMIFAHSSLATLLFLITSTQCQPAKLHARTANDGRPPAPQTWQEREAWFRAEEGRGWKGVGRARKVWEKITDRRYKVYDRFGDWQACVDRLAPRLQPPISFPTNTKPFNLQYLEGAMDLEPAAIAQMNDLSELCSQAVRVGYRGHWREVDKLAAVKAVESEYPTAEDAREHVVQRAERYFARSDLGKVTKTTSVKVSRPVNYQHVAAVQAKLGRQPDETNRRFDAPHIHQPDQWLRYEFYMWHYFDSEGEFHAAAGTTPQLDALSELCAGAVRAGYDDRRARIDAIEAADDAAEEITVATPYPSEETEAVIMREVERALQRQGPAPARSGDDDHGVSKMKMTMTKPLWSSSVRTPAAVVGVHHAAAATRFLSTVDRRLVMSLRRLNVNVAHAGAHAAAGLWRSPSSSSSLSSGVHGPAAMRQRVAGRVVQQELGLATHL